MYLMKNCDVCAVCIFLSMISNNDICYHYDVRIEGTNYKLFLTLKKILREKN